MADPVNDPLGRLSGLEGPRPLRPELRARLADQLLAADARPLSDEQDASLSEALRDPVGELLAGLDRPRPLPPALRSRVEQALVRPRRWQPVALAAGAAAAVVTVLVLAVPHDPATPRTTALPTSASPSSSVPAGVGLAAGGTGSGGTGSGGTAVTTGKTPLPAPVAAPQVVGAPRMAAGGSGGTAGRPAPSTTPTPSPAPHRPPVVDGLSPAAGPAGTWVTLTGHDLTPTTAVSFGGTLATRVEQLTPTRVRALAPPHAPGPVDVVLTTAAGSSPPQRYLYLAG